MGGQQKEEETETYSFIEKEKMHDRHGGRRHISEPLVEPPVIKFQVPIFIY